MKKHILPLLLCLAMLVSVMMTACNKKNEEAPPQTSSEAESSNLLDEWLPANVDLDGREIVYLSEFRSTGFDLESYTGEALEDCKYERCLYLEERFDCEMRWVEANAATALRQAHLSQDDIYDLVAPHPDLYLPLAIEGTFKDLLPLENLNLDQEWWNQSQVNGWSLNNHLYIVAGDTGCDSQAFMMFLCNENKYEYFGFTEDLYELVYDNKWTVEKMHEMIVTASVFDEGGTPSYGLCMWENAVGRFMQASEVYILQKNEDGAYELGMNSSKLNNVTQKVFDMLKDSNANIISAQTGNAGMQTSNFFTAFANGNGLFIMYDVGSLWRLLGDLEFNIDYLPVPKISEEQVGYHSVCANNCIGIPFYETTPEEVSLVLEAMTIYSHIHLKPTFINSVLHGRLSEDPADFDMLSYLHDTIFYDIGFAIDQTNEASHMLQYVIYNVENPGAVQSYLKGHNSYFKTLVETANSME